MKLYVAEAAVVLEPGATYLEQGGVFYLVRQRSSAEVNEEAAQAWVEAVETLRAETWRRAIERLEAYFGPRHAFIEDPGDVPADIPFPTDGTVH